MTELKAVLFIAKSLEKGILLTQRRLARQWNTQAMLKLYVPEKTRSSKFQFSFKLQKSGSLELQLKPFLSFLSKQLKLKKREKMEQEMKNESLF